MNVDSYLGRLYSEGRQADAASSKRAEMMLNITPSTGVFLDLLVSELKPKHILEIGTSNGYSTIWLARAAKRIGSKVDTVEISHSKARIAGQHLTQCDLQDAVVLHVADGAEFLRGCDSAVYDFVFLDADRTAYCSWVDDLVRVTRFGLLVVDNATTHPEELLEFKRHLTTNRGLQVAVLPIGNGQMIVQDLG